MGLEITEMTMNDYDGVMVLLKNMKGIGLSEADTKNNVREYMRRNPGFSFVAKEDGRIIGIALSGHDGRRGIIHHMAVAKPHRGKDIGRMLEIKCVNKLREAGITKCHLFVFRGNIDAQEFWRALDWHDRTDIVMMSKVIEPKK
jgi:putative acetyltransferase